ncbi:hypothetical protein Bbelb_271510 [Branchiostoma belcheri]|nr:hypothetical protein Bbelb_271510 [Branchiostoma belcheri]
MSCPAVLGRVDSSDDVRYSCWIQEFLFLSPSVMPSMILSIFRYATLSISILVPYVITGRRYWVLTFLSGLSLAFVLLMILSTLPNASHLSVMHYYRLRPRNRQRDHDVILRPNARNTLMNQDISRLRQSTLKTSFTGPDEENLKVEEEAENKDDDEKLSRDRTVLRPRFAG